MEQQLSDFIPEAAEQPARLMFRELEPDQSITCHCPVHGEYHPLIVSHPTCPACGDAAIEAEKVEIKRKWSKESEESWYAAAGLPVLHLNSGFNNYHTTLSGQEYAKAVAKEYYQKLEKGHHGNMVILGTTGTGKTHLACAIARCIMHRQPGKKPLFAKYAISAQIVSDVLDAHKRKDDSKEDTLRRYASYDLLVIDEYGLDDNSNETQVQALHRVIYERYNAMKPTIIVSNLKLEDIKNHLGDRILSRLKENGTLLKCVWADQRTTNSTWVE